MRVEGLKLTPSSSKDMGQPVAPVEGGTKNFGEFLTDALGEVNNLQNDSAKASFDLAAGKLQDVSR